VFGYWRGKRPPGGIARQMYFVGNKSLLFVLVTLGFVGMVMVYQTCLLTTKVVDGRNQVGAQWIKLLVTGVGPSLTAMMLATRVGAGIAAEIGSMVVTEQVDALYMCGADPIKHLVCPRFLASLFMFALLVVLAACVATATGVWTASAFFELNPRTFLSLSLVNGSDVIVGLTKCVAYGAAIPIISAHAGLTAFGGSEGVGSATTRAVVGSSMAVIALNFLISGFGYVVFGA
jgi:phospholipid/cholesterol/gamma-HCH transport system permease protein